MKNAIFYCAYKLKKGTDTTEFLAASAQLNDGYISKQQGYISWKQGVDGDTWVDMITFDSMDNLMAFLAASETPNDHATKFYSYINMNSCKMHNFSVEVEHGV